jgi:hypothetical protein
MLKTLGLAAVAAAVVVTATPTSAAIMLATYSGILSSGGGTEAASAFGVAADSLEGQRYSLAFRYDTALGETAADENGQTRLGGPGLSAASSPMLGATLIINGISRTLQGLNFGAVALETGTDGSRICHGASDPIAPDAPGPDARRELLAVCMLVAPDKMPATFESLFDRGADSPSAFLVAALAGADGIGFVVNGKADHLSIVALDAGGVPEPGVWATMILGFFGAGAALRRRRSHFA